MFLPMCSHSVLLPFFVLTGVRPIRSASRSVTASLMKSGGELPHEPWPQDRPETLPYEPLVRACTQSDPSSRPMMLKVYLVLSGAHDDHAQKNTADWHDALEATHRTLSSQRPQLGAQNEHVIAQDRHVDGQEGTLKNLQCGYLPTPAQTTAQILMSGLMSCNFAVPNEGFCCARHLAAKCSVNILQILRDTPCHADWPAAGAQCLKCGALVLPAAQMRQTISISSGRPSCDYCGEDTYTAAHESTPHNNKATLYDSILAIEPGKPATRLMSLCMVEVGRCCSRPLLQGLVLNGSGIAQAGA